VHGARIEEVAVFEGLLQPTHLLIILVIALFVFGPSKIGDLGGQLGRSVRDFKKATGEIDDVKRSVTDLRDSVTVDLTTAPTETGAKRAV
jgi:TatA/E family protein of Tat protein translocase